MLRNTCQIPNPIFACLLVNLLSNSVSQSVFLSVWLHPPSNSTCVKLYATGLPTS